MEIPEEPTAVDFASGDSFTYMPNTVIYGTWDVDFYLRYTTLTGASGITSFTVRFDFPECCGETDGDDESEENDKQEEEIPEIEPDDESEEPDEDTEYTEETTKKKSSSGCSAIIL